MCYWPLCVSTRAKFDSFIWCSCDFGNISSMTMFISIYWLVPGIFREITKDKAEEKIELASLSRREIEVDVPKICNHVIIN